MIPGFRTKSIRTTTLGDRLRLARVRKNYELKDVEEATKVRMRYLEALERDDYESLPAQVYAIGFLERYCDFLHLSRDKYTLEFKRMFAAWQSMQKDALSPHSSLREPKLIVTPPLILATLTGLVVTVMVSYIWFQVHRLTAPPTLEIITPSNETKVAIETIQVTGKSDPGTVIEINNQRIAQDTDGTFKESVALESGVNSITIVATNRFQKHSSKTIQVLRTEQTPVQPQPTPTS